LSAREPTADLPIARRLLQPLIVDPLWLSLETAPLDDEELTPEDAAALWKRRNQLRAAKELRTRKSCGSSD
jgi:hypothetical protein